MCYFTFTIASFFSFALAFIVTAALIKQAQGNMGVARSKETYTWFFLSMPLHFLKIDVNIDRVR